jgi:hypothetical protein
MAVFVPGIDSLILMEQLYDYYQAASIVTYVEKLFVGIDPVLFVKAGGFKFEISFNTVARLDTEEFVESVFRKFPEAKYIYCIMKAYLRQRKLTRGSLGHI